MKEKIQFSTLIIDGKEYSSDDIIRAIRYYETEKIPYEIEKVSWESTTPGFIKYITQSRYDNLRPTYQKWYKPYRCSNCKEINESK